jgi:hypothetical protein
VYHNKAIGGAGRHGGNGGAGLGGGLYNDASSTLTLTRATADHNFAIGGSSGCGGSEGDGIGGGVYADPLGTFTYDAFTVIKKNHASTSNVNIFH